jgi:hypothetical protein
MIDEHRHTQCAERGSGFLSVSFVLVPIVCSRQHISPFRESHVGNVSIAPSLHMGPTRFGLAMLDKVRLGWVGFGWVGLQSNLFFNRSAVVPSVVIGTNAVLGSECGAFYVWNMTWHIIPVYYNALYHVGYI